MLEKKAKGKSLDSRLRKRDLWGVQPTSGEAVNSFSMTFALYPCPGWANGALRSRPKLAALKRVRLSSPPVSRKCEKDREAPLFFLAPASVGLAGRLGEERAAVPPADSRPALHSPRAGSGKRRLPPITASTASCQVPAPASKVAAQTPHTHW